MNYTIRHSISHVAFAAAVASALGPVSVLAQPPEFRVEELPTLGGVHTVALDINDAGQIVGFGHASSDDPTFRALLWDDGRVINLSGDVEGQANAISERGFVAGYVVGDGSSEGRVWTPDGAVALPAPGGLENSQAWDVNDLGVAVGVAFRPVDHSAVAVQWTAVGPEILPSSGADVWAFGINNIGDIVGREETTHSGRLGLHWFDGERFELPSGGGLFASPVDISETGDIVGFTMVPRQPQSATLWTRRFHTIHLLDRIYEYNSAWDATGPEYVVGDATISEGEQRGIVWRSGVPTDLNDLIENPQDWTIVSARGINRRGQIVGYGYSSHGPGLRPLLLTPTHLQLFGPTPGDSDVNNTLWAAGANPGERVAFVYGVETGSTAVPICPGVELGIDQARLIGIDEADEHGVARIFADPAHRPRAIVLFQAIRLDACQASQVVAHTFL